MKGNLSFDLSRCMNVQLIFFIIFEVGTNDFNPRPEVVGFTIQEMVWQVLNAGVEVKGICLTTLRKKLLYLDDTSVDKG